MPPFHGDAGGGGKILFEKYELGRLLGCGAFAKVYHARDVRTGHSVAVKCFSKQKVVKLNHAANIKREISIMRRLRHPNIVGLSEVLATRDKIYFVMEFVKGGELFSRLESKGRHSEDEARKHFRQLVSAVGFCHSRGVFHRDLKPENILIDERDDLKVSDFGLSAVHDQMRQDGLLHTLCGTPAYVAPEILIKKGYDGAKVDVWSCGVILFVLVAGYLPFNDANLMAMYRKIYRGEYKCPKWTSPELKLLISRLLDTNPSTRITIDEIFKDSWFTKGLHREELAELSRFHCSEQESTFKATKKKTMEVEDKREFNAFDLISFSAGFDLSGLFEPALTRERFLVTQPAEVVLGELEKRWVENGLEVRRREGKEEGLVGLEARCRNGIGKPVATVEVSLLNQEMAVVEVSVHGREWEEVVRHGLKGIRPEPVPAGSSSGHSGP